MNRRQNGLAYTTHIAGDEPGSRNTTKGRAKGWGISLYTPVIVKYRDAKTDAKLPLEGRLRQRVGQQTSPAAWGAMTAERLTATR